jgi:hypothetical protein
MFCHLGTDEKTTKPYVLFVEGKYLNHSALVSGNRALMKILALDVINKTFPWRPYKY